MLSLIGNEYSIHSIYLHWQHWHFAIGIWHRLNVNRKMFAAFWHSIIILEANLKGSIRTAEISTRWIDMNMISPKYFVYFTNFIRILNCSKTTWSDSDHPRSFLGFNNYSLVFISSFSALIHQFSKIMHNLSIFPSNTGQMLKPIWEFIAFFFTYFLRMNCYKLNKHFPKSSYQLVKT